MTDGREAPSPAAWLYPHLDAVVGGVGGTDQVLVGPPVQVRVLPADEPVTRVPRLALALVHGVAEVAQVDALRVPVAAMGLVLAGVLGLTHLGGRATPVGWYEAMHSGLRLGAGEGLSQAGILPRDAPTDSGPCSFQSHLEAAQ